MCAMSSVPTSGDADLGDDQSRSAVFVGGCMSNSNSGPGANGLALGLRCGEASSLIAGDGDRESECDRSQPISGLLGTSDGAL